MLKQILISKEACGHFSVEKSHPAKINCSHFQINLDSEKIANVHHKNICIKFFKCATISQVFVAVQFQQAAKIIMPDLHGFQNWWHCLSGLHLREVQNAGIHFCMSSGLRMRNNRIFLRFYNISDCYKVEEIEHFKYLVCSAIFCALMQHNHWFPFPVFNNILLSVASHLLSVLILVWGLHFR